jgi:SH3-like domain-containing protein
MTLAPCLVPSALCAPCLDVWPHPPQPPSKFRMSTALITSARLLDQTFAFGRRSFKPMHIGMVALLLAAGLTVWMVQGLRGGEKIATQPGDITASLDSAPVQLGPSGFPVPRFLSLKSNRVNVRKGPSSDHPVAWVFQRKNMPVEVVAEFENWRKIRDSEGQEGWILQQMLSGRRYALAPVWNKNKALVLHENETARSAAVAQLNPGAIAKVESCTGEWCYLATDDYEGYARQAELWGVYPGEALD